MRASSLFLVGLLLGGTVVFLVRAVAQTKETPDAPRRESQAAPEPRAGHAHEAAPEPEPEPELEPEPEAEAEAEPSQVDADRPPENLICPVMGNEVDPEIYVDYEGRRIGFCCPGCDTMFLEEPEKYLKKVDAELRARGEK